MSTVTPPPKQAPPRVVAARSNMRGTLLSFAAVLGVALPYFIYSKRANDKKKRDRHMASKPSAFAQMNNGQKVQPPATA